MSAIIKSDTLSAGPDGVRRYNVTCKVVIHSHNTDPMDISQDVVHITTTKAVKSIGTAQIAFTPSTNYLNRIFPNDYINVYLIVLMRNTVLVRMANQILPIPFLALISLKYLKKL